MAKRREWIRGVLIVALLMLGFAFKNALIAPPSPPATVAPGAFDTSRAMDRLQRILGDERPHPVDSAANDSVRDRLIAELHAIGLQPVVHEALDCSEFPKTRVTSCARVRNVVATILGRAPGRHLLLNAHYDSTPTGPGAGDDGIGIATLLEVGSILRRAPPARPVTLLFNEGEEFGLNGSSAFLRDPLARQVNSLINIDARGVTGPALMFETSQPNRAALSIYARAARRPYANSLSTDFAKLIPNTTDVVEFRPAGWTLLNLGIIGNETRYHSPGDTVEVLDPASLYQLGSQVLALTHAMAQTADPASAGRGQTVFTDIAGRAFVHLPWLLAEALLDLLLVAALFLAWRERAFTRPLLLAAGMTTVGIVAAALVAWIATLARPGDFWRAYPLVTYLGIYAVLLAAMTSIWARWGGSVERNRMRAAAWLLVLLIGAGLSIALSGALIFFLLAPASALLGIALDRRSPKAATLLAVAASIIQFVMFAEMLALIEMLLIDGPLWSVAPLAALAALPAMIEMGGTRLRPALSLLVVAAVCLWIAALALPRSSTARPASFSIDYFRDADHNTASWGIATKQAALPSGYGAGWHEGVLPYSGRTRWIADAPLLAAPVAVARLVASQPAGAGRHVRIVLSPGGGDAVGIRFGEATRLLAIGLPGALEAVPSKGKPGKATLRCSGRSCDGFIFEAVLADRKPIEAELLSYRFSLPPEGQKLEAARPKNAIPQYTPDSTITLSRVKL